MTHQYTHLKPKSKEEVSRLLKECSYDNLKIEYILSINVKWTKIIGKEIERRRKEMPELSCSSVLPIIVTTYYYDTDGKWQKTLSKNI